MRALLRVVLGASLPLLAAASAEAQCDEVFGESAFSGDPPPPCIAPPPSLPPIRFGAELSVGWADHAAPLTHATSGVGLYADVALLSWLAVGARGSHRGFASDGTSPDGLSAFLVTGGPRFTLFTEPARHEALRLGLDAGALAVVDGVGPAGPIVEVSLERQAGNLLVRSGRPRPSHGTSIEVGLALRYQQGLGDASDYRAFLVSTYAGTELFSRLPEGSRPRRTKPKLQYTFSAAVGAGAALGDDGGAGGAVRVGVGFPLGKWLAFEIASDAMILGQPGVDAATVYTIAGGIRTPRWFFLYAEVLAGYSFVLAQEPRSLDSGPVLDLIVGAQLPNVFGCGLGVTIGPVTRIGLGDGTDGLLMVGGQLGMRYDNLIRAADCGY